jgi:hypothetical protein
MYLFTHILIQNYMSCTHNTLNYATFEGSMHTYLLTITT